MEVANEAAGLEHLPNGSPDDPPPSVIQCKGDEAETPTTGCGWGRFRPAILAPFAHVWTFIVLFIVFSFTHGVQGSYPIGVLTTLERRFNLSSSLAGFIVNTSLIGYLLSVVVVSLFFAKRNTPRLFAFCMLVTSVGAFLYFLPHIVCQTGNEAISREGESSLNASASIRSGSAMAVQLCAAGGGDEMSGPGSEVADERRVCSAEQRQKADEGISYMLSAVVILSIADFVHGIAGASCWTVGLAFIDDHTHPELSAKLISLMFTVRMLSPIVSFAMGGYFLSIHTTLKETGLTQKHPQWIGAWWLGFLINTIANFVLFIPMSMLPKNLKPIKRSGAAADASASPNGRKKIAVDESQEEDVEVKTNGEEEKKEEKDEVAVKDQREEQTERIVKQQEDEAEKNQHERENVDAEKEKDEKSKNLKVEGKEETEEETKEEEKMVDTMTSTTGHVTSGGPIESDMRATSIDCKETAKVLMRLIANPIYVMTVFSICADWASSSFTSFMPKYFEVHFQQTVSVASILGGMVPATCAACAAYVGGILAGKIKGIDGGVAGLCRMNLLISLGSLLLLVPAIFLSCPNIPYSGSLVNNRLNVTTDCNVNCGCKTDVFDPVCGSDGLLYFSPCHAGCTQLVTNTTAHPNAIPGRLVHSAECQCVAEVEGTDGDETWRRVVFAGFCESACASLIPYVVALVGLAIVRSLDSASSLTVIFRCIRKEDKPIALGLQTLCLVLSIIPAPLLYGRMFDSSCILKRTASCSDSKGSCLLYDRQSLRLNFHGSAIGLKSISAILYTVTYFLARRKLSLLSAEQKLSQSEMKTIDTK